MQYQKDEVRDRILEQAVKEFKKKGFKEASIRVIAKNSNTSVGNMYKYFENKEDLYENIVGKVYDKLMGYINEFHKVELNENAQGTFYSLMNEIMDIFNENSREFGLLLNKNEGSKYENCKGIFIDFITKIVTESMEYELSLVGKKLKDNFIIYLVSCSTIESLSIILREKEDGTEVRKLMLDLVDIFYTDLINKLNTESC